MMRQILLGAAAGAAGTTALNAATYADMTWRARPACVTPDQTVEKLSEATDVPVPGQGEDRSNRVSALGALSGILTGVGVGAAYGGARALGLRPPVWLGAVLATAGALAGSNGPMTMLGVSHPRTWSTTDWVSDVLPHLAYGTVTIERGLDEIGDAWTPVPRSVPLRLVQMAPEDPDQAEADPPQDFWTRRLAVTEETLAAWKSGAAVIRDVPVAHDALQAFAAIEVEVAKLEEPVGRFLEEIDREVQRIIDERRGK